MSLKDDRSARFHFFDLDRTIVEQNSSFAFCRYLCERRVLPRIALLQALLARWQSQVLQLSLSEVHAVLFHRVLKGIRLADLESAVDGFLHQFLWSSIYPPAFSTLKREQHLGGTITMMSSSPAFLVRKIAGRLGIDFWMATEYEVDSFGRLTGIKRFLDGAEKAQQLDRLSKVHGYSLIEAKAYSDSYHDLPFLLTAGKAVAVNPDHRLRFFAQQHQWEIL